MRNARKLNKRPLALAALLGASLTGCGHHALPLVAPPAPLGSAIDPILQAQEENAEAADFIIHVSDFQLNQAGPDGMNVGGWRLTDFGEDHVKQIAVNLKSGSNFPVVVERSRSSSKPGTMYDYPVHFNEELDAKRREVVVASLLALGVPDAESRVVVAPSFAEGITGAEAARIYQQGLLGGQNGGSRGGGFGGFGFGGFGGFGGGGIF